MTMASTDQPAQLALDLGHRVALEREDFLVAPCNETAVRWIDRWPDWSSHALALYGPPGSGKSHLSEVWRARSGAMTLESARLGTVSPPELIGTARACVIEDVDEAVNEAGLLHFFNMMGEKGGHILFTAIAPPARWAIALPDLVSRLRATPAVPLGAPDDALLGALIVKLFADRQLRVGEEVLAYLLARIERSSAGVSAIVAALDDAAMAEGRAVSVPLARQVLQTCGMPT